MAVSDQPAYVRRQPPNAIVHGTVWDALDQYEALGDRGPQLRAAIRRQGVQLGARPARRRAPPVPAPRRAAERRTRPRRPRRGGSPRGGGCDGCRGTTRRAARRASDRDPQAPPLPRARCAQPLDPDVAVYGSYWYRGYACNPRAIYEKIARARAPALRGVWVILPGHAGAAPGVETVVADSREHLGLIARGRVLRQQRQLPQPLGEARWPDHVQTQHGTPLKRMGMDLRDAAGAGGRTNFAGVLRRCRRGDFSVSANRFSTLVWERAYPARFESLESGYPRNDVLRARGPLTHGRSERRARASKPGQDRRPLRARAPGYERQPRAAAGSRAPSPRASAPITSSWRACTTSTTSHPLLRELHDAGRIRDVAEPSVGRGAVPRRRRARDRLLLDHVRLRRARPPDRHPRTRLGGLPRAARHVLRPA